MEDNETRVNIKTKGSIGAFSIFDEEDATWPKLLVKFSGLLNAQGYDVPIDLLEKYIYNGVLKEYDHRLEWSRVKDKLYKEG